MVAQDHDNYLIELLENPDRISSRLRLPAKALAFLGLNRVVAALMRNTSPLFEVIVRKAG